jgi:hypothetical protein
MKMAKRRGIESKGRVFADVTPGTKLIALALQQDATQGWHILNLHENLPQIAPHGTCHGISPFGVRNGHFGHWPIANQGNAGRVGHGPACTRWYRTENENERYLTSIWSDYILTCRLQSYPIAPLITMRPEPICK